jgi:hypothetical protein
MVPTVDINWAGFSTDQPFCPIDHLERRVSGYDHASLHELYKTPEKEKARTGLSASQLQRSQARIQGLSDIFLIILPGSRGTSQLEAFPTTPSASFRSEGGRYADLSASPAQGTQHHLSSFICRSSYSSAAPPLAMRAMRLPCSSRSSSLFLRTLSLV